MLKKKQHWELLRKLSPMERQNLHTRLQKEIDGLTKTQEENKACEDEDAVTKEINEYATYLQAKQDEANRKKENGHKSRKSRVDISLNNRMDRFIEDEKTNEN